MKRKLQTCASLLTAVVTMCLLFVGVSAAQLIDPPVYLDPSDQNIAVGQEITVDVRSDDVQEFYGAHFHLAFDDSVLEGVSVEPGETFTSHPDEYEIALAQIGAGRVRFAAPCCAPPRPTRSTETSTSRGSPSGDAPMGSAR